MSLPTWTGTALGDASRYLPPWVSVRRGQAAALFGSSALNFDGGSIFPIPRVVELPTDGGPGVEVGNAISFLVAPDRTTAAHMDDFAFEWHLTSLQGHAAATIRIPTIGDYRSPVADFSTRNGQGAIHFTSTYDASTLAITRIAADGAVETLPAVQREGVITDIQHIGVDASLVYVLRELPRMDELVKFKIDRISTSDPTQIKTFSGEAPIVGLVPTLFVRPPAGYGF
jgi:hypothetical protein